MINFLKFFESKKAEEGLNPKEYIYSYDGTFIIRSGHIKDRYDDPKRAVTKKKKNQLFKKAIQYCQKNGTGNQAYVFFVKSTNVGMVVDYRKDGRKLVPDNNLIMVTWIGDVTKPPISKTIDTFKLKYKNDLKIVLEEIGIIDRDIEFVEL